MPKPFGKFLHLCDTQSKCHQKNSTLVKPPKDSSMAYEESEDMYFWFSWVESLVKGFVSKGDLEKSMNNLKGDLKILEKMMENKMENTVGHMEYNIVERIVKLLQNTEEKLPKGDDVN